MTEKFVKVLYDTNYKTSIYQALWIGYQIASLFMQYEEPSRLLSVYNFHQSEPIARQAV
jgi:hypothetical protein